MRLEQNADAYQCEVVLAVFGEKQHTGVYCMFQPLIVQKCLIETSEVHMYLRFPLVSPTRLTIVTIALKQLKYDVYEFKR